MPQDSSPRFSARASEARHVRLSRGPALAAAGAFVALATWSAGSAWFILARDDIAQRVFARDAETTYAYQDRIKRLEDDLQREVTRNLVEKDGVSARIERMAVRQAEIETQQQWLGRAADLGSVGQAARPSLTATRSVAAAPAAIADDKPRPIPTGAAPTAELRSSGLPGSGNRTGVDERPRDRLSLIGRSLDSVSQAQFDLASKLRLDLDARMSGLRSAVAATGINPARFADSGAVGGPLVSLPPSGAGLSGFGALLSSLESRKAEYATLLGIARKLPLGRPLAELEQTSSFGIRYDPFTRAPAMHTGLDFRAETGTPARVTAAGRVTVAEWSGGYGNMVEVDHGGGITTRYGHLSAYLVSPGEQVVAGQAIGRVGSTGRSTGSHLHYETRIDGEPVDPNRFLSAARLASALGHTAP